MRMTVRCFRVTSFISLTVGVLIGSMQTRDIDLDNKKPSSPTNSWTVNKLVGFTQTKDNGPSKASSNKSINPTDPWIPPLVGEWVYEKDKQFLAPICCGVVDDHFRHDPSHCGNEVMPGGEFHRNDNMYSYSGRKEVLAHMQSRGTCVCSKFRDEYTWKSPVLPDFDPHKTCKLLGNRKALFIGDSTMAQAAVTLMNAVFPAGCQVQMKGAFGDTLVNKHFGMLNRGPRWLDTVRQHDYDVDIVVLSAAAHIDTSEHYYEVLESVVKDVQELHETRPQIKVVWKSIQPAGCANEIAEPSDPVKAALDFDWSNTTFYRYQHKEFYGWDEETFREMGQAGIPVLDMRMLYSRQDAHPSSLEPGKDCVHFCAPGPLDVFAQLFQKMLQDGVV